MKRAIQSGWSAWVVCSTLLACAAISSAEVPEAYPGSFWGNATHDFNNVEGWGTQGRLYQAIQWTTLPGDFALKTYAAMSWRLRSENQKFFNAYSPAIGVEVTRDFLTIGADYEWRDYPTLGTDKHNFFLYLIWYKEMDFFKPAEGKPSLLGIPVLGFPTTTWGHASQEFNNLEGTGTQGWISQGINWIRLPQNIILTTQATYHWRVRTKNQEFYNSHGPGLGVELGRNPLKFGVGYRWQRFPERKRTTGAWRIYLTWYLDWDLKGSTPPEKS